MLARAAFVDDLITRGNGVVKLPPRHEARLRVESPRWGRWRVASHARWLQEGVAGDAWELQVEPTAYLAEDFTTSLRLSLLDSTDWLIWRGDDRLGGFSRQQLGVFWNLNWFPAAGHEVRLRAQYIGLRAQARRSFLVGEGRLLEQPLADDDFSLGSLGLQLRYRFEFAPQRELCSWSTAAAARPAGKTRTACPASAACSTKPAPASLPASSSPSCAGDSDSCSSSIPGPPLAGPLRFAVRHPVAGCCEGGIRGVPKLRHKPCCNAIAC